MQHNDAPRIYVRCLAAYNAGYLHGSWIDVDGDVDDLEAAIATIIESSPVENAEEWAIHDFENWHGIKIDEHESLEKLVKLAELLQEHGKAYAIYYEYQGSNYATPEDFEETYRGMYESQEDFVQQQWDEQGKTKQLEELGINQSYINWEVIARDWFIDSYYSTEKGYNKVYVFSRQ